MRGWNRSIQLGADREEDLGGGSLSYFSRLRGTKESDIYSPVCRERVENEIKRQRGRIGTVIERVSSSHDWQGVPREISGAVGVQETREG